MCGYPDEAPWIDAAVVPWMTANFGGGPVT